MCVHNGNFGWSYSPPIAFQIQFQEASRIGSGGCKDEHFKRT